LWTTTLLQKPQNLQQFLSTIAASPMLIPFDATSGAVGSLMTNSSTAPFPPPLSCYPSLSTTQVKLINSIETSVFNLSSASANSASTFDTSCFSARPAYGVLDILRLRTPFLDNRTGVAQQAAVLDPTVGPRAVVYSGEVLGALPGSPNTNISMQGILTTDPRQYGTLNHLNHVMFNYLSSINVNVAIALVTYILSNPSAPPPANSIIMQNLATIPSLEVAVFGSLTSSDVTYAASSLVTPSGGIFFGSDQGQSLRNWAYGALTSYVAWAGTAGSSQFVRDNSTIATNSNFQGAWSASVASIKAGADTSSTVAKILNSFASTGLYSS